MAKTSINIQPIKVGSELHNKREKELDYVNRELSQHNEYWEAGSQADRMAAIKAKYLKSTGQKMQAKATPIREGVIVIEQTTTMADLQKLANEFRQRFGIDCFQIAIHKDEGHANSKEWKPNLHAHMVFDWTDPKTGKTIKLDRQQMAEMQTITARVLEMDRGKSSEKKHLSAIQQKVAANEAKADDLDRLIAKKEKAVKSLQTMIDNANEAINKLQKSTESKEKEINKTTQYLAEKEQKLEKAKEELTVLQTQASQLEGKINSRPAAVYHGAKEAVWAFLRERGGIDAVKTENARIRAENAQIKADYNQVVRENTELRKANAAISRQNDQLRSSDDTLEQRLLRAATTAEYNMRQSAKMLSVFRYIDSQKIIEDGNPDELQVYSELCDYLMKDGHDFYSAEAKQKRDRILNQFDKDYPRMEEPVLRSGGWQPYPTTPEPFPSQKPQEEVNVTHSYNRAANHPIFPMGGGGGVSAQRIDDEDEKKKKKRKR